MTYFQMPLLSWGAATLLLLGALIVTPCALLVILSVTVADESKLEAGVWGFADIAEETTTYVIPEETIVLPDTGESGLSDTVVCRMTVASPVSIPFAVFVVGLPSISDVVRESATSAVVAARLCIEGGMSVVGSETTITGTPSIIFVLSSSPGKNGRSATGMVVASEIKISS